jgi:hypothetical protein
LGYRSPKIYRSEPETVVAKTLSQLEKQLSIMNSKRFVEKESRISFLVIMTLQ